MIIYGAISVKSAVINHKRTIDKVFFAKDKMGKDERYIARLCEKERINAVFISKEEMLNRFGKDCGKVVAECSGRNNDTLEDLLNRDVIFYLDGLEDPYNYGYCLRTLCAFGFDAVITSVRDFKDSEATVLRSSAGAMDRIHLYMSENEGADLSELKERGYRFIALERSEGSVDLFEEPFDGKVCILLGGERRGIRKEILKMVDKRTFIPYGSDFRNALNAVSALAVVSSYVFQRRRK